MRRVGAGFLFLVLAGTMLAGCVSTWVRVDGADEHYAAAHYQVSLPRGWLRIEDQGNLLLSKDGPDLQRILIQFQSHEKAFAKLEKDSSASMLPSELAELAIAELKASGEDGLPSLQVLRNEPVEIAGHMGFAIHARFKTDDGLRIELLLRGFVDERGLYLLTYRAPTLHYFARDLGAFESVVASFRI